MTVTDQLPVPTPERLEQLYEQCSNWGRWGDDDELGALNLLTPERRVAAMAAVRSGLSVSLAHDLPKVPSVENPFPCHHHMLASGDRYDWSLEWGNTSQMIPFQAPDVIDVLPWNGDFAVGSLSKRDQYATDFQGSARLIGELSAPVFLAGATGEVAGTWYYSTANPATINHDSRVAANASPQTPGGLWLVAGEVSDFSQVTAIRFVSSEDLPVRSRVRADIPARSTSTALDNVYVNRASIVSPSFPDDLLFSNEPYVLMPGFTLGDLVWEEDPPVF